MKLIPGVYLALCSLTYAVSLVAQPTPVSANAREIAGPLTFLYSNDTKGMRGEVGYVMGQLFETGKTPENNTAVVFAWKPHQDAAPTAKKFSATTTPDKALAIFCYMCAVGDGNEDARTRLYELDSEGGNLEALWEAGITLADKWILRAQVSAWDTPSEDFTPREAAQLLKYRLMPEYLTARELAWMLRERDVPQLYAEKKWPRLLATAAVVFRNFESREEIGFSKESREVAAVASGSQRIPLSAARPPERMRSELALAKQAAVMPLDLSLAVYLYDQAALEGDGRAKIELEIMIKEGADIEYLKKDGEQKATMLLKKYPAPPRGPLAAQAGR